MPTELDLLIAELVKFRDDRDWTQFHNSKDLALAISIEAAELNELFLWKKPHQVSKKNIEEELADIFAFALLLARKHNVDVPSAIRKKMRKNGKKYPVVLAKGNARKYTELKNSTVGITR